MSLLALSIGLYFLAFISSLASHFVSSLRKATKLLLLSGLFFYAVHVGVLSFKLGSFPFADIYGFYSLLGSLMLCIILAVSFRYEYLWKFSAFFATAGVLSSLLALPAEPSPYRNPLYSLHVTSALASYIFAFFAGLSSLFKLVFEIKLKQKNIAGFYMPLSLLRGAERLFVNLSFVFLTLTLIFGSLWSRSFFGRHWIDDPKLIFVLFLWTYYALVVHLSLFRRIKPRSFSYAVILGALLVMLNIAFIRHEL